MRLPNVPKPGDHPDLQPDSQQSRPGLPEGPSKGVMSARPCGHSVGYVKAPEADTLAHFHRSSLLAGLGGPRGAPTGGGLQGRLRAPAHDSAPANYGATCSHLPGTAAPRFTASPRPTTRHAPRCPTIKIKGSQEARQGHDDRRHHLREHRGISLRGAAINLLRINRIGIWGKCVIRQREERPREKAGPVWEVKEGRCGQSRQRRE